MDIRAKVKYLHFLELRKHLVRTKHRMLFFTRLMVMVPRVLLHNQPKIRHNLRIKVNSNRKEQPSPTLVKLHSQQQLVVPQNLLKEMSSEQFCSPSTLERQILKLEKLILVFLLIEMTLHSMHSSNRLRMFQELSSSILQILQKQYSILLKYTMVLVQLHYLVHIRNSSSLQHMLVLVDLQNMELQSRNKYLAMSAKVPSTHLLELPKVSRENLLQERSFTPRLVLQQPESRATLSMPAQEHSYQQEQQQKPDMFLSILLLEQSLFLENSLIQKFNTFPQSQLVDYQQYLELQQLRTLSYHLHLVVSSVLDLETKHTQEILMSVSEV